jgi:hypothetical protein
MYRYALWQIDPSVSEESAALQKAIFHYGLKNGLLEAHYSLSCSPYSPLHLFVHSEPCFWSSLHTCTFFSLLSSLLINERRLMRSPFCVSVYLLQLLKTRMVEPEEMAITVPYKYI